MAYISGREHGVKRRRFWFVWCLSLGGNKVVGDEVQSERLKRQCKK
jgi:hypothetical protein